MHIRTLCILSVTSVAHLLDIDAVLVVRMLIKEAIGSAYSDLVHIGSDFRRAFIGHRCRTSGPHADQGSHWQCIFGPCAYWQ